MAEGEEGCAALAEHRLGRQGLHFKFDCSFAAAVNCVHVEFDGLAGRVDFAAAPREAGRHCSPLKAELARIGGRSPAPPRTHRRKLACVVATTWSRPTGRFRAPRAGIRTACPTPGRRWAAIEIARRGRGRAGHRRPRSRLCRWQPCRPQPSRWRTRSAPAGSPGRGVAGSARRGWCSAPRRSARRVERGRLQRSSLPMAWRCPSGPSGGRRVVRRRRRWRTGLRCRRPRSGRASCRRRCARDRSTTRHQSLPPVE